MNEQNKQGRFFLAVGLLLVLTVFCFCSVKQHTPTAVSPNALSQTASEPIDLNTATKAQLMLLPGIGEVLAQRIIAYRTENGSFTKKETLLEIYGISEKKFEQIKDLIVISTR